VNEKKSYEVMEVENGFIVFKGSMSVRLMHGSEREMYIAKDMYEVGKVLVNLDKDKEVK
jgi:hypothetical protein